MPLDGNDLDQVMNTAGEAHSFQDGALFGVLAALVVTGANVLTIVAALLGIGGAKVGRKQILKNAEDLLRTDAIRTNPEYAVVGFVVGFAPTAGVVLVVAPHVAFL